MIVSPWDNLQRVEKLREMWAVGMSAATIGARLGVSKNSVISRVRRENLPPRPSPIVRTGEPRKRPPAIKLPQLGVARLFPPLEDIVATAQHWLPIRRAPLPIPVGAIGPARACQWTECDRAPWRFCEAVSVPGYSWCADHRSQVFTGGSNARAA